MVSLIFATLSMFSLPSVTGSRIDLTTQTSTTLTSLNVSTISVQNNGSTDIIGYNLRCGNTLDTTHAIRLDINTSQGVLPLRIEMKQYSFTGYNNVTFSFSYADSQVYMSNMYLGNVYFTNDDSGDSFRVHDIYFDGRADIMNSDIDGSIGFDDSDTSSYVSYSFKFDMMCMPSSMVAFDDFYVNSFDQGYDQGYHDGYAQGDLDGYADGLSSGTQSAYDQGFSDGETYGIEHANEYTFAGLFGAVADTPVLMVRNLFNFEFFGVNVLTVVLSLFTALIVFYILRKLL